MVRVRVVRHGGLRRRALGRRVLRGVGEALVTVGAVLVLLLVHQVWWTGREAGARAEQAVRRRNGRGTATTSVRPYRRRRPGPRPIPAPPPRPTRAPAPAARPPPAPDRSRAFAILSILPPPPPRPRPRVPVAVPVAEGVGRSGVLDEGYVGHYPGTQQPGRPGDFALAGHRNTHGEPFRYVDRLTPGDAVLVETRRATYTYAVDRNPAADRRP